MLKTCTAFAAALAMTAMTILPAAAQLPTASPESVGFDSARLQRLDAYMARAVAEGRVAGMTTMLVRHGKIVHSKAYGYQDLAKKTPMKADTIFRIYSMTKAITGVAMMMLLEEGKWQMDDPVTKFIPEFKDLRVMTGTDANGNILTEPMKRPPTMRELMSHTAGFGYGITAEDPLEKLMQSKKLLASKNLQEMINGIAQVPLRSQPGTEWFYSISVDIQGYLVEKLSGQKLSVFFDERIFKPLKMVDTAFSVKPGSEARLATLYANNPADGSLMPGRSAFNYLTPPQLESGGGGLVSTMGDYARFGQMLLNKGELDGVRLLSPAAVELMYTNVVPMDVLKNYKGTQGFNEHVGFGVDFRIIMNPRQVGRMDGANSFDWGGAAATWFWGDPTNDLLFVGMLQRQGGGASDLRPMARVFTYGALVNPEK